MADKESTSSNQIHTAGPISEVYLLGNLVEQIVGMKLPSNRQALGYLLYNIRVDRLTVREGARLVVREILKFWKEARLKTPVEHRCMAKLENLYHEHRILAKSSNRKNQTRTRREMIFCDKLEVLFDIGHQDALEKVERPEDKHFLLLQRKKGRLGHMIDVSEEFAKEMERRVAHAKELRLQQTFYTKPRKQSNFSHSFSFIEEPVLSITNILVATHYPIVGME